MSLLLFNFELLYIYAYEIYILLRQIQKNFSLTNKKCDFCIIVNFICSSLSEVGILPVKDFVNETIPTSCPRNMSNSSDLDG